MKTASQALGGPAKGVLERIGDFDFLEETAAQSIIDNLEWNLRRGRLLLLAVGDRIREGVEDMANYLSASPQLLFTLGLIELQVYRNPSQEHELIVVPNLITRTRGYLEPVCHP